MEIRWEGTLIEKFPALISAHKKSKKKKQLFACPGCLLLEKTRKKKKVTVPSEGRR